MTVIIPPQCLDDKVDADFRMIKITSKKVRPVYVFTFAYCPECESYLMNKGGKTKSEIEAAKDLYRTNPHMGNPRNIVSAEYIGL